ncbi:MAG TPA: hypothetical protein VGD42_23205 [Lysobacter sp.]
MNTDKADRIGIDAMQYACLARVQSGSSGRATAYFHPPFQI